MKKLFPSLLAALLILGAAPAHPASWRQALPGYRYEFPRDHGAHEAFRTEWWYFSGNLRDSEGERYPFMLTFFRAGLRPGAPPKSKSRWALRNLYFGHFSVLDAKRGKHRFSERISRGELEQAGASEENFKVWLRDWSAESEGGEGLFSIRISAATPEMKLSLELKPAKPLVIHGEDGVSRKAPGPGRASHYYSYTRLLASGALEIEGRRLDVRGTAWMDHEFGSNQLTKDQVGWDWLSLQLSDGRDLMLYLMRRKDGGVEPTSSGTLVEANGRATHLRLGDFRFQGLDTWKSERSGAVYPMGWEVEVPAHGLRLRVEPYARAQEIESKGSTGITYWEGGVFAEGVSGEKKLTGVGFVEMTGYAPEGRPKF